MPSARFEHVAVIDLVENNAGYKERHETCKFEKTISNV